MKKSRLMGNKILLLFLIAPFLAFARGKVVYEQTKVNVEPPWLTGPLIAPSAHVVPGGHVNIEPYFFINAYTGTYSTSGTIHHSPTFWSNNLQIQFQVGILPWMDITFTPQVYYNYTEHQASWQFGDIPWALDFQLYFSRQDSIAPNVKLSLKSNVPTGKYRNLNPKKLTTDVGGLGSWGAGAGVVLGNLYHFGSVYYMSYRLSLSYIIPTPVRLTGFNFYGGGFGTDVRFFPPQNAQVDLGLEFTLAQTWALALDIIGYWTAAGRFSGKQGVDNTGLLARIGRKAQIQYSLAPAIEYNFNANIGLIAGGWFTFSGRNALVYRTAVLAINYYK